MNANEPAYPLNEMQDRDSSQIAAQHFGMTLRMRYAMAAMQGLLANPNRVGAAIPLSRASGIVEEAWFIADLMVAKGNEVSK